MVASNRKNVAGEKSRTLSITITMPNDLINLEVLLHAVRLSMSIRLPDLEDTGCRHYTLTF